VTREALEGIAAAFRAGRRRPPDTDGIRFDAPQLQQYAVWLERSLGERLAADEWAFIKECSRDQNRALRIAQDGDLADAQSRVRAVWKQARSRTLSVEAGLVLTVFLKPVDAYLAYKIEDYDRARELVRQASAVDHRLVAEFGHPLLSAPRLQLAHNRLRVDARSGRHADAVALGSLLLDYLELRAEPRTAEFLSSRAALDEAPGALVEYYFDKVGGELALLIAGRDCPDARELFGPLDHHVGGPCLPRAIGARTHEWLRIKHLVLVGDVDRFLAAATTLLQVGRRGQPLLWHATVVETIQIWHTLGPEGARIADGIAADAAELPGAPARLEGEALTGSRRS
jgi:hypothetical protein